MARPFNGERMVFSTNGTGTTEYPHSKKKKNEVEPLSYTIGQKLLKMNKRAKII